MAQATAMRQPRELGEPAYVLLVRGSEELFVYHGELKDCLAWLALNGDKPTYGEGHFELRDGPPPGEPATGSLPPSARGKASRAPR